MGVGNRALRAHCGSARLIEIVARHESDFGRTIPVVDSVRRAEDILKFIIAGNDGGLNLGNKPVEVVEPV